MVWLEVLVLFWYAVSRQVVRGAFRVLWPTTTEGLHKVPTDGPVILASNHLSFIDSVVIPMLVPRRVAFLAKAIYFQRGGLKGAIDRHFFTMIGAIPVEREKLKSATASLEEAVKVLEGGGAFGIYPEGTRSRTGLLYRGRTGVAWLALNQNVKVIPVGIQGTTDVMNVNTGKISFFRKIHVQFGDPIDPADFADLAPGKARRLMTDAVMDSIGAMTGQPRSKEYAPIGGANAAEKAEAPSS